MDFSTYKIEDTNQEKDWEHFQKHGWSFSFRDGMGIYVDKKWIENAKANGLIKVS